MSKNYNFGVLSSSVRPSQSVQSSTKVSNYDVDNASSIVTNENGNVSSTVFKSPCIVEDSSFEREFCPQCQLKFFIHVPLKHYQIFNNTSVLLCTNKNCNYPFETPGEKLSIRKNHALLDMVHEIPTDVKLDFDLMNYSHLDFISLKTKFEELKSNFAKLENGDYTTHVDDDVNIQSPSSATVQKDVYNGIGRVLDKTPAEEAMNSKDETIADVVEPNCGNIYEESILNQIKNDFNEDFLHHFD